VYETEKGTTISERNKGLRVWIAPTNWDHVDNPCLSAKNSTERLAFSKSISLIKMRF